MGANSGKNFTCSICSERVTGDAARPDSCPQHIFHRKCLVKSASHSNQCPIDKKEFFEIIYEGGARAIIQHQNSEDFRENPVVQEIATQLVINSLRMVQNFTCEICKGDDIESGVASPMDCEHRFHKPCLLNFMKTDNHCPSCWRKVEKIMCSNGETVNIEENRLRHVMAALSADENFKCDICDSGDTFQERALVGDCKHEFHRECIVEYARHDSTCPTCSKEIMKISCLYGSVLSVGSKSSAGEKDTSNDENKDNAEQEEEGDDEENSGVPVQVEDAQVTGENEEVESEREKEGADDSNTKDEARKGSVSTNEGSPTTEDITEKGNEEEELAAAIFETRN